MGNQFRRMTFEIDNFSQRDTPIQSNVFRCGSHNWYVTVDPKEKEPNGNEQMSLYLSVADPLSQPQLWFIRTRCSFGFLDPYINRSSFLGERIETFHAEKPSSCLRTNWSISYLQKRGYLVNDKLRLQVSVRVSYSSNGSGGVQPRWLFEKKKETVNVSGFEVLRSQVKSAKYIFETYPDTALYIQPQHPQLKKAYMDILLRIYEKLYNSPLANLTKDELSDLSKGLLDLTQAGFKLEWLREKLEDVSAEKKKLSDYEAHAEELGKQLKNCELMMKNLKAEIKLKTQS